MAKSLYFRATKDVTGKDGEPVVIAGVRCRFLKGKAYEVETKRNDKLVAELEKRIASGDLERLGNEDGPDIVDAQDKKRLAEKAAARAALKANNITPPLGDVSAKVE